MEIFRKSYLKQAAPFSFMWCSFKAHKGHCTVSWLHKGKTTFVRSPLAQNKGALRGGPASKVLHCKTQGSNLGCGSHISIGGREARAPDLDAHEITLGSENKLRIPHYGMRYNHFMALTPKTIEFVHTE